jgi:hypothetical protein
MTTGTLNIIEKYCVICCDACGVSFAITDAYDDRRRADHKSFYCPNGHSMSYSQKNEAEKQRERADRLERRLANRDEDLRAARAAHITTQHRLRATKGVLTKTKKRVANGVCPCCNRTFQQLERHMKSQHPDYAEQVTA